MACLFADIGYPAANVAAIRQHGHEVVTCVEAELVVPPVKEDDPGTKRVAVAVQLSFAQQRAAILLTENWWDYHLWRWCVTPRGGIICTPQGTVPTVVAELVNQALAGREDWANRFVKVKTETQANEEALCLAAVTGKLDQARQCLRQGISIDNSGALHSACYRGRLAIVNLFLDHHADVNLADEKGMTPLMWACGTISEDLPGRGFGAPSDYFAIIRRLLEQRADVDAQDMEGKSALHHSLTHGINSELVELLLAHGANQDLPDRDGVSFRQQMADVLEEDQYDR